MAPELKARVQGFLLRTRWRRGGGAGRVPGLRPAPGIGLPGRPEGKILAHNFTSYALNLLAVPFLALASSWAIAAGLPLLKRIGKAVSSPRVAMSSNAAVEVGRGWGLGFHEAMDQIGAVTRPLVVAAVLYSRGGYREGFALLLLPAVLALLVITLAGRLYPYPMHLEKSAPTLETAGFTPPFWLYTVAVGLLGVGYADFPLIAYRFGKLALGPPRWIRLFYAAAMAVDAVATLLLGRLFDGLKLPLIMGIAALSACFALFVFSGGGWLRPAGYGPLGDWHGGP
jgi:hypothetical protein